MKKFFSLLLVAVLLSAMLVVPASADDYFWAEGEYEVDGSGNWHPNNAWGYVFNIDALNTSSVGENGAITSIFTNVDDYLANAGGKNAKWKAHIILAPTEEDNVYEVVQGYEYTEKTAQQAVNEGIGKFDNGKIILLASYSCTRPEKKDGALLFPNWEDRAACWGLVKTVGAKLTLAGIDLKAAAGACTGTLTVEAEPKADDDTSDEDDNVVVHTNVALNKEYTISGIGNRDSYYGDVTDGFVAADLGSNKNAEWFGFYQNGNAPTNAPDKLGYFIIDLEDTYTLTSARVHMTNKAAWGIVPPEAVTAYVSLDGNAYEEIGSFEGIIAEDDFYWVNLENINVKAKYVKIEVKLGGTFAFVSEVEIYGGKGAQTPGTSTPDASTPDASTPDASTPDASTPETSDKEDTEPGDASSMIIFAIIALVAIAGSAVVIKTRK